MVPTAAARPLTSRAVPMQEQPAVGVPRRSAVSTAAVEPVQWPRTGPPAGKPPAQPVKSRASALVQSEGAELQQLATTQEVVPSVTAEIVPAAEETSGTAQIVPSVAARIVPVAKPRLEGVLPPDGAAQSTRWEAISGVRQEKSVAVGISFQGLTKRAAASTLEELYAAARRLHELPASRQMRLISRGKPMPMHGALTDAGVLPDERLLLVLA